MFLKHCKAFWRFVLTLLSGHILVETKHHEIYQNDFYKNGGKSCITLGTHLVTIGNR